MHKKKKKKKKKKKNSFIVSLIRDIKLTQYTLSDHTHQKYLRKSVASMDVYQHTKIHLHISIPLWGIVVQRILCYD